MQFTFNMISPQCVVEYPIKPGPVVTTKIYSQNYMDETDILARVQLVPIELCIQSQGQAEVTASMIAMSLDHITPL